jgi:DNA-binding CsgD family transcriptional regulator
MSKQTSYLSFKDYLTTLAVESGGSTADYGLYLREMESLQRFTHFTSSVVFLIDYRSMGFPFMGTNVREILGHPLEAYDEGGLEFSLHNNQDFAYLNREIFEDRAAFMADDPGEDLQKIRFSMGFRYRDAAGKFRHILQRHTLTELTDGANPGGILGFCWDMTAQSPRARIFHQIERFDALRQQWETAVLKEYFPEVEEGKLLSKRELEILKWALEGLPSKQIADRLYISIHTVNNHRKNMLRKTNSQNMVEVAQYAMRYGLL